MRRFSIRIHFAWIICLCGILIQFVAAGISCNIFSVFQPFFAAENGFTQTQLSLMVTVRCVAQLLAIALISVYYRHFSLRTGAFFALLLSVLSYLLYGLGGSFALYLTGAFLMGTGNSLAGMIVVSTLMENWFVKNRTLAISLGAAGSGLATIGIPSLMVRIIEAGSVRLACFSNAAVMLLLALFCLAMLRDTPAQKGLLPYTGSSREDTASASQTAPDMPSRLQRSLPVDLMMLLCGALGIPGWGCVSLNAAALGYSSEVMALAVSLMGTLLMLGKALFGFISERLSQKITSYLYGALMILACLSLALAANGTLFLYFGAAAYGFSISSVSIGMVTWVQDWVAPEAWPALKKRFQLFFCTGSICFSPVPGIIADLSGRGYRPTYVLLALFSAFVLAETVLTYRRQSACR